MGFGLMFVGFFVAYAGYITPLATFMLVLGAAILIYSLKSLVLENKLFVASAIAYVVLFVVSTVVMGLSVFGKADTIVYKLLVSAQAIILDAGVALLMLAIGAIAKNVDLTKLRTNSIVAFGMICLHGLLTVIGTFVKSAFAISRIGLVSFILFCMYVVFCHVIIFNSYMWICYEDDKNMERESGGFAPFDFLNKMLNKALKKDKDFDDKGEN